MSRLSGSRSIVLRLLMAFGLTLVLVAGWNLPAVVSLGRPLVISLLPSLAAQPVRGAGDSVSYPRLGIEAPVSDQPNSSPVRVTDWVSIRQALLKGTALSYEGGSFREAPLAFLTGHSSDTYPHPYSAVFAGLGQAKAGDSFTLSLGGTDYGYVVESISTLDPARPAQFAQLAPSEPGQHVLALVTCWPVFTTNQRLVLVARRV